MNAHSRWRDPLAGTKPSFIPHPDDPVDPARRERELRVIFAEPRPSTGAPRTARRLSVATVAAAVAVVAATVVGLAVVSDAPDPDESSRQVLLAAAEATTKNAVPAQERYWHVRQRSKDIEAMWPGRDHDAYLVTLGSGSESWISRTGADRSVSVSSLDLTTRPLTERDKAEWDKAGNPVGIPDAEPAPDASPAPPMPTSMPPSAVWSDGEQVFMIGGAEISVPELLALPTDGARLKEFLLDRFRENRPSDGEPTDETDWLMWEVAPLLNGAVPTTPGTRAAAYQLLADLPGFRVMDGAEVPAGSVGVAREIRGGWSYTVKDALLDWQVIIDPETGSLREWRLVLVEPGSEARKLPAGTVVHAETIEQVGWVHTEPVLPPDTEHFGPGPGE